MVVVQHGHIADRCAQFLLCLVECLVSAMEEVNFWEVERRVVVLVQRAVLRSQEPVPEEDKYENIITHIHIVFIIRNTH